MSGMATRLFHATNYGKLSVSATAADAYAHRSIRLTTAVTCAPSVDKQNVFEGAQDADKNNSRCESLTPGKHRAVVPRGGV